MCDQPLEAQIETYLKRLARTSSSPTFASHQTTLRKFAAWKRNQGRSGPEWLRLTSIAAFCIKLQSEYAKDTVKGDIDSLANFLAYVSKDDPTLIKVRIASYLERYGSILREGYQSQLEDTLLPPQPTEESQEAVGELLRYLRHHQFGTRTHAIVETIFDTKTRPYLISEISLGDFQQEVGSLRVKISEQHILSKSGLLQWRRAPLTQASVEALSTYVEYDRPGSYSEGTGPLFSTCHGSISKTTIRRLLRTATEKAPAIPSEKSVTAQTVWRVAINDILTSHV